MKPLVIFAMLVIALSAFLVLQLAHEKELFETKIASFSSPEEFRDYISRAEIYAGRSVGLPATVSTPIPTPIPAPAVGVGILEKVEEVERVSQTNVQVFGIDEPDIVKTDGKNIYISRFHRVPTFLGKIVPPYPYEPKALVVKAFPPKEIEKIKELNISGDMIVYEKILVFLSRDKLRAFSTEDFKEKYKIELNGSVITARLYEGKIYLIISQFSEICPIIPLNVNGAPYVVECRGIYYPTKPIPVESVYTVVKISANTGEIEDSISFVGNYDSVIYMSKNAVYVAYYSPESYAEVMLKFVSENMDLFPSWFREKLQKLINYDLSEQAKQVEIWDLMRRLTLTMDPEERLVFENEISNRYNEFMEKYAREIEKTAIWKISLEMEIVANGEVPGRLLNQFSMDEYKGDLRVAVTVGNANDLYVLDPQLKIFGYIKGFGETERIYAVRFIADKGYIVTFRQIDPFFVVDLSDPTNPRMAGELKIPGYSSYLHPLKENLILGIGMEDGNVKLSLFDVSDPKNPREVDKYLLKEHWSEVISNHRAFLQDEKHGIFFLPASSGYVFSYKDGLKLIKATETGFRAVFINDYLYIIGSKIVVFDEVKWEKVAELEL
ncbi:MAG: beta-propeller domain-containing protein [Archaeoglobaceae archaeon]|nr:beta-propeller domain-containing protein [Archaeoglobaceae archaeon]MDW8127953.1 beta-propeller domain-containing protein [Archaeoglobaceae archaeon]